MPVSLSSFINPSHYTKETIAVNFVTGMKLGSTFVAPAFGGACGGALNNPGGMFGWLIYSRSNTAYFNPAKGTTSDKYILYSNPGDLVGDLNKLSGITNCLLSPTSGATANFFYYTGSDVTASQPGMDFLYAISYLAYGGQLVIVGDTTGLDTYQADSGTVLDTLVDKDVDSSLIQWLENQTSTIGIVPSIAYNGVTGAGVTMQNYANLFSSASVVTSAVAKRMFNVYGTKTQSTATLNTTYDISSLLANGRFTYTVSTVADVAGFFARAKNRNEQYLTIAGLDRAIAINGSINNSIDWNSSDKTSLRNKRLNFFVNYDPRFLGADLVGATSGTTVTVEDRIGPATMRAVLTEELTQIGLKYNFELNNESTRAAVTSEIETMLEPYATYLDTGRTQIICDSSNNTDNSSTLNITLIVKPIVSVETFTIDLTFQQ
jgi:hypothetical protein